MRKWRGEIKQKDEEKKMKNFNIKLESIKKVSNKNSSTDKLRT